MTSHRVLKFGGSPEILFLSADIPTPPLLTTKSRCSQCHYCGAPCLSNLSVAYSKYTNTLSILPSNCLCACQARQPKMGREATHSFTQKHTLMVIYPCPDTNGNVPCENSNYSMCTDYRTCIATLIHTSRQDKQGAMLAI